MKTIDPGHRYELRVLDGEPSCMERLQFVKRIGKRYPGNEAPAYAGTTTQEVLRALIDRATYVNSQIPCAETEQAIRLMEGALLLFEIRAKRVKGKTLKLESVRDAISGSTCNQCGHVFCSEHPQR